MTAKSHSTLGVRGKFQIINYWSKNEFLFIDLSDFGCHRYKILFLILECCGMLGSGVTRVAGARGQGI